jgi:hypothetical protein
MFVLIQAPLMNLNHLYHYHYRPKSYGDQGIDVSGLDYVWATERTFLDNKTGPILTIEDSLGNTTVLNGDENGRIQISDLEAAYAVGGELRVRTFHELKGTGVDATDATFSRQAVLVEANGDVNYLNGAFAPVFKTTNHLYTTSTNIGGQPGLFTTFIGQADFSASGNLCPIGALTFNWMRIEADGDVNMRIRDKDLGVVVIQDTLENNFTVGDQQLSTYLSNRGSNLYAYSNGLTSSTDSSTALEVTDANLYIGSRGSDQFLGHGVFWGAKDGEYSEDDTLMASLNRYYFGGVWEDTGIWNDTGIWDGGIELPNPDDLNVAPTFVGLLDTYSGAAAAYSTRQLKASSTLSMRVRKEVSSVGSETDIGFDSNGDLDTATLLSFASDADGGNVTVSTWYDQAGTNHATNSTESEQPLVVSGGSLVTENGKAAVDFDGVDDHFDISNFTGVPTISQFNVLKPSATNVDETFTSLQNATTTDGIFLGQGNLGTEAKFGLRNYQGADVADSGIAMTLQQYLLAAITTSTTAQIYANGVAGAISAKARGNVAGDTQIGANGASGNNYSGKFQEIIIFESDQSSNRTGIETNINDHFNIYP